MNSPLLLSAGPCAVVTDPARLLPAGEKRRNRVVVSVGGGISSTLLLPLRAIREYGRDRVDLVMAYLPNEDPDTWRLVAAMENLTGLKVQYIGTRETPFDVFHRVGMMGNTRVDPCSRILKREAIQGYLSANYERESTLLCVGITAHETSTVDRRVAIAANYDRTGWRVAFPLFEDKTLTTERQQELCQMLVGFVPSLYKLGFNHNNCGGACVKAGKGQWARLLWHRPAVFAEWRDNEARFRAVHGDYAILRDEYSIGGKRGSKPLTLAALETRLRDRWAGMLPGIDPFDGLEDNAPCMWCEAL